MLFREAMEQVEEPGRYSTLPQHIAAEKISGVERGRRGQQHYGEAKDGEVHGLEKMRCRRLKDPPGQRRPGTRYPMGHGSMGEPICWIEAEKPNPQNAQSAGSDHAAGAGRSVAAGFIAELDRGASPWCLRAWRQPKTRCLRAFPPSHRQALRHR